MRLINRDTDSAVRVLLLLAQKDGVVTVPQIMDELGAPRAFLRKITQMLSKGRILRSGKGKSGGFSLNRAPSDIYLSDIMEIFQGDLKLNECLFNKKPCPDVSTCPLRKRVVGIESLVIREVQKINLQSILDDATGGDTIDTRGNI